MNSVGSPVSSILMPLGRRLPGLCFGGWFWDANRSDFLALDWVLEPRASANVLMGRPLLRSAPPLTPGRGQPVHAPRGGRV